MSIMTIRFVVFKCLNPAIKLMDAFVPSPEETYICCWGALRGAVGLALGLVVWGNKMENFGKIDDVYVRAKRAQRAKEPEKSEATKKFHRGHQGCGRSGLQGGLAQRDGGRSGLQEGLSWGAPDPPRCARSHRRSCPPSTVDKFAHG
jgi:hypothetical protein